MKKRKWSKREVKLICLAKLFFEKNCKVSLYLDKNYYFYNDLMNSRFVSSRHDEFEFKTLRDFKNFLRKFNDFVRIKTEGYLGNKIYNIIRLMRVNDIHDISIYLLNDSNYIENFKRSVMKKFF